MQITKRVPVISPRATLYREQFRNYVSSKTTFIALIITAGYFVIAILDTVYPRYLGVSDISTVASFSNLNQNVFVLPQPPTFSKGWWYFFGTTFYGIPIFPVMLASMKLDLFLSFTVDISAAVLGTFIGVASAALGGKYDLWIMRFVDIFLSFPILVFALAYASVTSFTLFSIQVALIVVWWPVYSRLARSKALTIRRMNYVEAARASGSSRLRAIFSHFIPNLMSPLLVQFSLDLGSVIGIFASIVFILSNQILPYSFVPELGNMLAGFPGVGLTIGAQNFGGYQMQGGTVPSILFAAASGMWWTVVFPGIFLLVYVIAVNIAAEDLRDFLDPRTKYSFLGLR